MTVSRIPLNRVFSLEAVRLRVDEGEHPWQTAEREAIAAHWAREQIERPWLFNGTVMMHRDLRLVDGTIAGTSHRAPYAALLHWVKTQPEADVWHLFGSAVMLSSDNAMLLIRMAAKTANAGRVYAPAGSLDESDIRDGQVNVEGSILREAMEETGCDLTLAAAEKRLWCWRRGRRVAIFRRFRLGQPAALLVERIREHIRTDAEQEIEDVVVVRAPGDAGPTVTPYMQAMIDFHFAAPGSQSSWQADENG
ncbi:NUDIX hydrolase [Hoeflea sp. YIM 152468]|uniref:NUDIX domain-containing protein n=1 Tax=Hoeflea sp. YIM 152468 TaxID=3031759 RepID=UPI0023DB625B|nr:NUDIX domain-containing protein [Hoeflea sp. YIM 152468]MDF1609364.1 NUDIX hydrolase [Hoeflea sp. YIM 152468]